MTWLERYRRGERAEVWLGLRQLAPRSASPSTSGKPPSSATRWRGGRGTTWRCLPFTANADRGWWTWRQELARDLLPL